MVDHMYCIDNIVNCEFGILNIRHSTVDIRRWTVNIRHQKSDDGHRTSTLCLQKQREKRYNIQSPKFNVQPLNTWIRMLLSMLFSLHLCSCCWILICPCLDEGRKQDWVRLTGSAVGPYPARVDRVILAEYRFWPSPSTPLTEELYSVLDIDTYHLPVAKHRN